MTLFILPFSNRDVAVLRGGGTESFEIDSLQGASTYFATGRTMVNWTVDSTAGVVERRLPLAFIKGF